MKKILSAITLLLSVLILSTQQVHAVIVQKNVSFTIEDYHTTTIDSYAWSNLNVELYDKLDELYADKVEDSPEGTSIKWYATTIKKNGVSYTANIMRRYSSAYDADSYTVAVYEPNHIYRISVYEKTIVYEVNLTTSFSQEINTKQAMIYHVSKPTNYQSNPVASFSLSEYVESTITPEDGVNVTDFSELPNTTGKLSDASNSAKVGYVYFTYDSGNLFNTYSIINGVQYNIGKLDLPGVEELNKEPLSPGIYWTEGGKQYIYYEFQQPASERPIVQQVNIFLDDPEKVNGFRPFVQMNLTDETYAFTDKLSLYAGHYDGGGGKAYADVLFPMDLDDLLTIEISYKQRWVSLWGWSRTSYEEKTVNRYKDEVVNMNTTWQHVKGYLLGGVFGFGYMSVSGWNSTIQKIEPITNEYALNYTEKINAARNRQGKSALTKNQIFKADSSLYRIYLDTYNDGRYTGYEIADDIVIVDVMYQYQGEVFHVAYSDIKTEDSFGGGGGYNPLPELEVPQIDLQTGVALIAAVAIFILGIVNHKGGITRIKANELVKLAVVSVIVAGVVYFVMGYIGTSVITTKIWRFMRL